MGEKLETQVGGKGGNAQYVSFTTTPSIQLETSLKDMEDRTSCSCGHLVVRVCLMWTLTIALDVLSRLVCDLLTSRRRGDLL